MQEHIHPISGRVVVGVRLTAGVVLQDDDVYDATSGSWEKCLCPGLKIEDTPTIWIRPTGACCNVR